MIFKEVGNTRPYPEHEFNSSDKWAMVPPRQVSISEIITTQTALDLDTLLSDDSTFYGDLFPHIISDKGELSLENGVHSTLRAALQQRDVIHARVLYLAEDGTPIMNKSFLPRKR
jgi:Arc/MetJ family transcription regulator